ncbi:hypothetical protein MFUL124B02_14960 [Myxococcus fulvus 124B02]|nr:hypothetical protein MFUL124B02_14960 [Myxococcus fulvus 124B02]
MKRAFVMMVAVLGVSLLACGGEALEVQAAEGQPDTELAQTSQELITCTALCYGNTSVSCTGSTCTATNYQNVTCDGVVHYCPATVCPGQYRTCAALQGRPCVRGTQPCCRNDRESYCYCIAGTYSC